MLHGGVRDSNFGTDYTQWARALQPRVTKMANKGAARPPPLGEQRTQQSHRVGREEEGLSSTTLQAINKFIGGGAKLNLAKTADADVLKAMVITLLKRVKAGAATLLIKVRLIEGTR